MKHPFLSFRQISITLLLIGLTTSIISCKHKQTNALFTQLNPAESGIHFKNVITETDSSNSFINEFGYMGGGVGIGDFNNDGLKDIFFTGNQVSCRLYMNKGDNQFEDVTTKAGLTTNVWATGVSIVDINNDGYDDIYVCVFGKNLLTPEKNLLFINEQDGTFKEEAAAYGLADIGYSTQAVFFDYNKDGYLDMYLTNYLLNGPNANSIFPIDHSGRSLANDKLYRNNGVPANDDHPVFEDVTMEANIKEDGYGLGVVASDLNNDGWPDIYVANDFVSNDELWLNNKAGAFTNCIATSMGHQSYSSMGADAADINNDGLPDVITLDMLPEYNRRKKLSFSFMNYERYGIERSIGFEPEFSRNMLQLNNGLQQPGNSPLPFFSEIGQLAGIAATDWSWSVLIADFNNDGWKDVHITNGIGRDFINADFLEFSNSVFSGDKSREEQQKAIKEKLAALQHINLKNYLYLNNQDLTFSDVSESSGVAIPSMSNGAAYADLDNDGDLDLIVNNINQEAFVFINNTIQKGKPAKSHYLSVELKGDSLNRRGFGAKVLVYADGKLQMAEQFPVRGYFSSVDQRLFFGLGSVAVVDSLLITWPDGRQQLLKSCKADTLLTVSWSDAVNKERDKPIDRKTLFSDIANASGILYRHHENEWNDYALQRLLPQKYSQLGPFISTGDINHDGREDFFVGGAFNFSGKIFTQQSGFSFFAKNLTDSIKMEEDAACIFFDADQDGDLDLLVTGGGMQYDSNSIHYKPRLYLNDGTGNFKLDAYAIPSDVRTIAGCVSIGDFDNDGYPDIFIGGRVSMQYPVSPKSFILHNLKGKFADVTAKVCPELQHGGMITGAAWTDFDNDGQTDLVVAGEWMPVRFFKNNKGVFTDVTAATGLKENNGMWRSLVAVDIDNDGDIDLVAGNLGLNNLYKTSATYPMELFATDLDGNGKIDPVFFYYIKDEDGTRRSYPGISRSQLAEQVPSVKKQFLRFYDYANATFDDIFKGKSTNNLLRLFCNETRSCWFENTGKGKFIKHPLPVQAQFAPVNAILCEDFDQDGYKDLLLAGNEYQTDVLTGRYDASYGCFLKGNRVKNFQAVSAQNSGFFVKGDVKDLAMIHSSNGEKLVLAAVNNDTLRVFKINAEDKKPKNK
jgi:enediyne biosynthesis protein E4